MNVCVLYWTFSVEDVLSAGNIWTHEKLYYNANARKITLDVSKHICLQKVVVLAHLRECKKSFMDLTFNMRAEK